MNAEQTIKQMLAECAGLPEQAVTSESHIVYDLGLDSLEIADLMMQFENHFKIQIPEQELQKLQTVEQIIHFINTINKS